MGFLTKKIVHFIITASFLTGLAGWTMAQETASSTPGAERIEKAIQAIKELAELPAPEESFPPWLFQKSEGIAVFPGVIKAAYGIGGQYGRGILMIKNDKGNWSRPVFATLVGGSLGFQIGVQKTDIILVFKTRKSVENIAAGKLTLGADISVAAGPVGRQAEAATDLDMEAEIYSYSKSKGLFAGVSIKGGSIQIDPDANSAFYGRDSVTVLDIFSGRGLKTPEIVDRLRETLEKYTKAAK